MAIELPFVSEADFADGMVGLIRCSVVAEQKVKVPSAHCDSRVRTVCADVMALMKQQARAMSPQVR